jgi:hypothetical protein
MIPRLRLNFDVRTEGLGSTQSRVRFKLSRYRRLKEEVRDMKISQVFVRNPGLIGFENLSGLCFYVRLFLKNLSLQIKNLNFRFEEIKLQICIHY